MSGIRWLTYKNQMDEMRAEMIKTDRLEMWEKYMERAITMVLSILENRMRKIEIGGEMMAGLSYVTNDNPSPQNYRPGEEVGGITQICSG